ncbi:Splicing factor, suppressor of white-apricot homolog [Strongyloides ratti]|uniref:Splicing factor, suppressor of white-apricot homolog n=1 Tax=Strongyloides ratti TaxID=34506 RepID=A0A090LBD6_STRRB|nr:Splicing factor, suppressor of white-apricot homolog [Strongyloides ratti]CEF64825.1 Splicing factor, suppressor of white-apricot homolog [Strongyloides ratti]
MEDVKVSPETRNVGMDSDDDEFIQEPYVLDSRLKLPDNIILPKTMREGSRIEKTASFVALKGSQMEIFIRVRQKHNASKFNFLDFEHPLNAFYKAIINEVKNNNYQPKNYTPKRKVQKSLCDYSSSDNDDSNSYLHPTLVKKPKKHEQKAPIGPMCEKEANFIIHKEVNDKAKVLMKQKYDITQGKDMYSKLFKNLVDHAKTESSDTSQKVEENSESKDYYEWYTSVYKIRHSLEPTTLPPIFDPPKALQNIINSAINYIITNGIEAERKLLEANPALTFLLEGDPNYFYYQLKLKQKHIDMGKWNGNKKTETL